MSKQSAIAERLPIEGELPSLDQAITWINSPRLTAADLRGKVVLIDFWTYTCINWRRTLPYLRAWADRYRDQGLVVIGVHTPEFGFERDLDNIRRETRAQDIGYPVAVDSEYAIWNAFDNHYWPALYFVDSQGRIRHHQFGEGDYDQLERVIRQLLIEAGRDVPEPVGVVAGRGAETEADWKRLKSPETYLGHGRSGNFASPEIEFLNRPRDYSTPERLRLNYWGLGGNWTLSNQSSRSNASGARVTFRFHARDVHLVMGPARPGAAVRFRVSIVGLPPGDARGVDIDDQGNGTLDVQRMYTLIRQPGAVGDRTFEIEFFDAGAEVFVFTFG